MEDAVKYNPSFLLLVYFFIGVLKINTKVRIPNTFLCIIIDKKRRFFSRNISINIIVSIFLTKKLFVRERVRF